MRDLLMGISTVPVFLFFWWQQGWPMWSAGWRSEEMSPRQSLSKLPMPRPESHSLLPHIWWQSFMLINLILQFKLTVLSTCTLVQAYSYRNRWSIFSLYFYNCPKCWKQNQQIPDFQDFLDLLFLVGRCLDDDHPIEHVNGYAMGRHILGASDTRDAAVGGYYYHWSHVILQCPVKKGKAFDVQHVYL